MTDLFKRLEKVDGFSKGFTCRVERWRRVKTNPHQDGKEDDRQETYYALKVVHMKTAAVNPVIVKQVQREKAALDRLGMIDGPRAYLVDYFGSCKDDEHLYFILGYVDGGDLYKHIQCGPGRRLPLGHAQFYCAQIGVALSVLHRERIVYRDLKANNVALTRNGNCKLFDFGRSKILKDLEDRTTTILGLGHHCAPEIVKNLEHGFPVDWWSLGVLLIEMTTGRPPFEYVFTNTPETTRNEVAEAIEGGIEHLGLEENRWITEDMLDLLKEKLMPQEPSKRVTELPNLLNHPFFAGVDLEGVEAGNAEPPLPLIDEKLLHETEKFVTKLKEDPFADW